MNNITGTPEVFSSGQKAFHVLSCVPFAVFALLVWKIAKKPLEKDDDGKEKLYTKRLMPLYSLLVASLIGIFICVAIPHSTLRAELGSNPAYTVYAVAAFGILLGFNVMVTIQMWSRIWYKNESYVLPSHVVAEHLEPLLDPKTIEVNSHSEIQGKDLPHLFDAHTAAMDKTNDLFRRRVMSMVMFVVICYLTIMDGFFIVYWTDKSLAMGNAWLMISMAWIVRFAYSVIICGILIHGLFHAMKGRVTRWVIGYPMFCALYFIVLVLSSLPLLLNMSIEDATHVIQQIPFTLFYGIAAGIILWFLTYFVWIQDPSPTRASTSRHLALIWIVTLVIGVTGLFI